MIPSKRISPPSYRVMTSHTPLITGEMRYSYSPIALSICMSSGMLISSALRCAANLLSTNASFAAASDGTGTCERTYRVLIVCPSIMISTSVDSLSRMISKRSTVIRA